MAGTKDCLYSKNLTEAELECCEVVGMKLANKGALEETSLVTGVRETGMPCVIDPWGGFLGWILKSFLIDRLIDFWLPLSAPS